MTMTPRDKALRKLWLRGDIQELLLEPHQINLLNVMNQDHVELFYADLTRRGGKTFAFVTDAVSVCIKSKQTVRYAAAFLSDLLEFVLPTFEMILESCPEDLRPVYTSYNKTFKFSNGSTIKLLGLDKNPNGIRGNAVTRIYLDEAGFVMNLEYIYKSVIIPATARRKHQMSRKIKVCVATTPPEDATEHYCYELKTRAETESTGAYYKKTIDDIASIDDEEKARLIRDSGGIDSVTVKREFYCCWIADEERAICPQFDDLKHIGEAQSTDYVNWIFSADAGGVQDKTVGLLGFYCHSLQKLVVWDEISHEHHTASPIILKSFTELLTLPTYNPLDWDHPQVAKFLDGPGQIRVDYAALGFDTALPNKEDLRASLQMVRSAVFKDEILIHPRCKLLIATLKNGLLNSSRTDFMRSKSLGHCDAVAAFIYMLRMYDKVQDRRPAESRTNKHVRNYGQKKVNPLVSMGWR